MAVHRRPGKFDENPGAAERANNGRQRALCPGLNGARCVLARTCPRNNLISRPKETLNLPGCRSNTADETHCTCDSFDESKINSTVKCRSSGTSTGLAR